MARLFTDVIRDIAGGELVDEATTAINNLVTAVDETGKGGSVVVKITVKPNGRGGGVNVGYDVAAKIPQGEKLTSVMWPTPEGDLLATDPRQKTLDLKTVPDAVATQPAELKTVNS
ncbi:MAG TPA: hypothetical protein PK365_20855 [Nitrospira sp.]|nr:hypothetical protein [Nitrospira sp.]